MGLAQSWINEGAPFYRGKYLQGYEADQLNLPGIIAPETDWRVEKKRLNNSMIEQALNGSALAPIGFFGSSVTNCVTLDIDNHNGAAWLDNVPTKALYDKYRNVCADMGKPSLLFKSPRGLHSYYKLTDFFPALVLNSCAYRVVEKHGAEVRPTMQLGLRFPVLTDRIHPETFKPITGLGSIEAKHPALIFGDSYTQDTWRGSIQENNNGARALTSSRRLLAKAEERVIKNGLSGVSNEALCSLAPMYFGAGLSIEEASQRFRFIVHSTGYRGEFESEHRTRQRIASVYRGVARKGYPDDRQKITQQRLFDSPLINELVRIQPFAAQRREPVRRFLVGLLDWINYQESILEDPAASALWNYLYPYHRKNTRAGWYALPRTLLKRLNSHYESLLPFFIDVGLLTPSPFGYSTGGYYAGEYRAGYCKHYAVARDVQELHL